MQFLSAIGAWIGKNIVGWFQRIGHQMIDGMLSTAAMWSFHGMVRIAPDEALSIARKISASYFVLPVEWAGFISEYLERMGCGKIEIDTIVKQGLGAWSRDAMQGLGHTFLEPMLGLIMPTPEQAETEPMAGAERFMSANLQFQMSGWLLHLLGDAMSFGMFKSLKDLPNAISWSYGIGWLSWMVMGPVFRAGITAPMEKKFAEYYRQAPLSNAQIVDAFYSGRKSAEETYRELAQSGLKDEDIETYINLARKRLPQAVMEYLVRKGFRDKGALLQYYKDQSYTQEDAEAMVEQLLTSKKRELISKIADRMEELYKAGIVSPSELKQYYVDTNLDDEEQNLALTLLDLDAVGTKELTDSQIARLYQTKVYTYQQALDRLKKRYTYEQDAIDFLKLYPLPEEE
jgi:hypothetical protein